LPSGGLRKNQSGFFGVVPGTNEKTNKNAFDMIHRDAIFTNVGRTADNKPWWEGKNVGEPAFDWRGREYDPKNGPAAHPNSRFTIAATNNPSYSSLSEAPEGVPISALVFGGRRATVTPLVYEAKNWKQGVMLGASIGSKMTAAAAGEVGKIRRDPMAMKPFCGYNFGDYWQHWLSFEDRTNRLPKIFGVNWFRQDDDGNFLWPGFGENLRVLRWIIDRCENRIEAVDSPIGLLPEDGGIDTTGLDVSAETMRTLTTVDVEHWRTENSHFSDYLDEYGKHVPNALRKEQRRMAAELEKLT